MNTENLEAFGNVNPAPKPSPVAIQPFSEAEYLRSNHAPAAWTTWRNPLLCKQRFSILVKVPPNDAQEWREVTVPPGGTVRCPSFLDQSIRTTNHDIAVAGMAPALVPISREYADGRLVKLAPTTLHDVHEAAIDDAGHRAPMPKAPKIGVAK
jgi:hypothetical protein